MEAKVLNRDFLKIKIIKRKQLFHPEFSKFLVIYKGHLKSSEVDAKFEIKSYVHLHETEFKIIDYLPC